MTLIATSFALAALVESIGARMLWLLEITVFNGVFLAWLAAGLLLEWVLPARREERGNWKGLAADFVWSLFKISAFSVALIPFARLVHEGSRYITTELGLPRSLATGSNLLDLVLTLLIADFLFYWSHRARHKVAICWRLHAVHHSQERLNVLTCHRTHPLDDMAHTVLVAIPAVAFHFSPEWIVATQLVTMGYTRFYHANVRISLGPLRHVLVTPQFHRIHHSRLPEHADRNFGLLFSFWDRMFGTWVCPTGEYPATGVVDFPSPVEGPTTPVLEIPAIVWRQFALLPPRRAAQDSRVAGENAVG